MDWSNEVTLEFLRLYEKSLVIWDPKHLLYKNRTAVHEAWLRIQNAMSIECSIYDLKKKKESLMANFRVLYNKVQASKMLAAEGAEIYKPSWFAYDTMARFLQDVYQPRNSKKMEDFEESSEVVVTELHDYLEIIEDEVKEEQNEEFVESEHDDLIEIVKHEIKEEPIQTEISAKPVTLENNFESPLNEKNLKRKHSSVESENSFDRTPISRNSDEECKLFANLLASKLRNFDVLTRDVLMHEIDDMIFKTKMDQRNVNYRSLLMNDIFE